jgi:hypothetical protein
LHALLPGGEANSADEINAKRFISYTAGIGFKRADACQYAINIKEIKTCQYSRHRII